jgi:hypothetical protein
VSARVAVALLLVWVTVATGCQSILGAEPTPVPGAAATLTRSVRTPIPTVNPSPATSPVAARSPSVSPGASPKPGGRPLTQDEIAGIERQFDAIVASADLPGIEQLLFDRVSLATPAGGQVLDRAATAQWLREHAGPGLSVVRVDPNTQTMLLEVQTEGWPIKDPLEQGRMTFNLRRYAANGRQDEENGDWKIDVIGAE